jgi:outer membrane lipoprotein-sorting protein
MRLTITLLLAFAATAAAQDNPALPVVKAAIEAHGGADALTKARTARQSASGTMIVQGKENKFSYTAAYATPDKYRVEMTADIGGLKVSAIQILNGKKTKMSVKYNGTETAIDPKAKDEVVQSGLLKDVTLLTPLLDKKYTLKLEKEADVNGQPAAVVSVTGNGLKEVKLFFDKKTNRLVKTQRRGYANGPAGVVEVNEEIYLSDFKKFDRALLPTAIVQNHDSQKYMTATVTEWKFVDKIDDKEFSVE